MLSSYGKSSEMTFKRVQNQKFIYKKGKRYIRLTQEKKDSQDSLFSLFYQHENQQNKKLLSLVLDEDLCVISKNGDKIDFQRELEQKFQENQKQIMLSFIGDKDILPQITCSPVTYEKVYEKYLGKQEIMSDFQFGRTGFGRNRQSHKIESDSISKFHSTIWHYQSNNLAAKKNENIIYRTLTKKTPLFSKFRELPSECWSIIFSYLRSSDKYYLMDEGSRNGTFVYELQSLSHQLHENYQYEYNGDQYSIFVDRAFTSENTKRQSIERHNQIVSEMIEEYKKKISWSYYEQIKKYLLIEKYSEKEIPKVKQQKLSLIHLRIRYRENREFYCLVVPETEEKVFTIGHLQDINIKNSFEEYEIQTLDGHISWQKGKWRINGYENGIKERHLWVKIPSKVNYQLKPTKNYLFRLAYTASFKLQFHNFENRRQE